MYNVSLNKNMYNLERNEDDTNEYMNSISIEKSIYGFMDILLYVRLLLSFR